MRLVRQALVGIMIVGSAAPAEAQTAEPVLMLSTSAFPDGGVIPVRFSQAAEGAAPGEGTSPALSWVNVPSGTQSFVIHMHDLSNARNRTPETQLHWLVWNIPGSETGLPEGLPRGSTLPNGAYQVSATGPVYRGPGAPATRPPHHYLFELYALDTVLEVEPREDPFEVRAEVLEAMKGHVIGKSVYMGRFSRPE